MQDAIHAVLSVCDDLPAGSFKQSMLDRLNHRSAVLEEDLRLLGDWIQKEEKYVASCREHATACLQRMKDSEVESSHLDSYHKRMKEEQQDLQDQQQNVAAQGNAVSIPATCSAGHVTRLYLLWTVRCFYDAKAKDPCTNHRQICGAQAQVRCAGPADASAGCGLKCAMAALTAFMSCGARAAASYVRWHSLGPWITVTLAVTGSSLLKVIKNIDNPQLVPKELDELLTDILGMKDVFEWKRMLHWILVLYHGLSPMAHFPPLAPPVNVSGATGPNAANINGVYRPVEGEGVEQAGVRVMRHAAAVQVSGATGPHAAIINGVYRPVAGEGVGGS